MSERTFIVLAFAVWIAAAAYVLTADQDREIERFFVAESTIILTRKLST